MASGSERVNAAAARVSKGFTRRGAEVAFACDGRTIMGLEGESLAASLAAAGLAVFHPNGTAAPRGLYCGMGVCRECLVSVDGVPNLRACMTTLAAGMQVETLPQALPPARSPAAAGDDKLESPDVLVIGGGPAGLSAAAAAAATGASVTLLDERSSLGGQYFKQLAPSHAFAGPPDAQFAEGLALLDKVRASGVRCETTAVAWGAFPGPEIAALVAGRQVTYRPRRLVLATGAHERGVPLPGWTLPGCMSTGAAQSLVRANRVAPGSRVVIAGNGPLNWQLAAELLSAGVEVVAIAEAAPRFGFAGLPAVASMLAADAPRTFQGMGLLARLARLVRFSTVAVEVHGTSRAEAVTLARVDAAGRPVPGSEQRLQADTACMGYGFIASSELARALGCRHEPGQPGTGLRALRDANGRSSVQEVFITGDGAGMGGAAAAMAEGTIAGTEAAADLGFSNPVAQAARAAESDALSRHRRFQAALWTLFRAPPLMLQLARADTLVCRCESVTLGALRDALAGGEIAIGSLKRQTRAGMGRCQGRYCGALLHEVIGVPPADEHAAFAPRPPARPLPIGLLAHERSEE